MIINKCRYGTKLAFNFNADLVSFYNQNLKIAAEIPHSNGDIRDKFSEQRHSTKTSKEAPVLELN